MDFLKVDSLETAKEKIFLACGKWLYGKQDVPLEAAHGRVLAKDVFSPNDLPHFRRSSVDGFAIQAKDVAGAGENSPAFLQYIGAVLIGNDTTLTVESGTCVEVPTGGKIPHGADAVVMVEYTEILGNDIAIYSPVSTFENIVEIGDDIKQNELILKHGQKLKPKDIGILAAMGITSVSVQCKPKVAIISTGDELVNPAEPIPLGKVRDISSYSLKAQAEGKGFDVISTDLLPDDINLLESTIKSAMSSADIIFISGGSSYGKYDLTAKAIESVAAPGVFTHGLALKPGKPTILAVDEPSQTLIVGLPGHPVSAMVVFELLFEGGKTPPIPAKLSLNAPADGGKMTVYPCRLTLNGNGYIAEPIFGKSAAISTLAKADGYFVIQADVEGLKKDANVLVHLL